MTDHRLQADAGDNQARRSRIGYDPTRARGEDAFSAAHRHGRLVRSLRYILPALAVAAAGLFWASFRFVPNDLATIVSLPSLDGQSNSVVMDKPHISGFEGTRRAYDVRADRATQSLNDPKVMTFTAIAASVRLDASGVATIEAATGIYNGNANTLVFKDGIAINTTTGYQADLREAVVDLGAGSLVSSQPIELRTNEGTIRANSVEVSDRGKRIAFRGGVSVTYLPPAELVAAGKQ